MTFGLKTNERPGTRAELKYARFSAYKAREVLNLIRNKPVAEAQAILRLTERGAAEHVLKTLNSAIANAEHNDGIAAEELYVSACFADEGPTLKRFRPRARGRAGRINKRTCHITVIVSRLSPEELEQERQRQARRGQTAGSAASRSRRVAGSRKSGAAATTAADESVEETTAVESEVTDEAVETTSEAVVETTDEAVVETAAPYGEGSAAPLEDGSAPDGFTIKGNADSMLYHTPDSPFYGRTVAEVWFDTAESAEAAGFSLPPSLAEKADDEPEAGDASEEGDK